MKVMLVITDLDYGGAEIQVVKLAKAFFDRGHTVTVVSIMKDKAFRQGLQDYGISVISLDLRSSADIVMACVKFIKTVRSSMPDVIHSHMYHANIFTRMLKLLYPAIPIISTAHSTNEGAGTRHLLYKLTKHIPAITTNVSKSSIERYSRLGLVVPNKSTHMYNGIEIENATNNAKLGNEDIFKWIAIGRLVDDKDYHNLIYAVKNIYMLKNFELKIIGEGRDRPMLESMIKKYGLQNHVKLEGHKDNIPELLSQADAMVMSSRNEGLPMVLLEAGLQGLPIVATNVGGNAEVVLNGMGGYVVIPENSVDLANHMLKIMHLGIEERKKMGQFNRLHVSNEFDLNVIADGWIKMYESVSKNNPRQENV